jgi:hypothetical protein
MANIFQSEGLKRKISAALAAAAVIAGQIPALAPYQGLIAQVAGWLGALGWLHAGVSASK